MNYKCNECDSELEGYDYKGPKEDYSIVAPCKDCLEDAYNRGVQDASFKPHKERK